MAEDGSQQEVDIEGHSFSFFGKKGVLEYVPHEDGYEIVRYKDNDKDGVYDVQSTKWFGDLPEQAQGVAARPGKFGLLRKLNTEGTDGDDDILLQEGEGVAGGQGQDNFVYRELVDTTIEDFNVEDGDELVFDTGHGLENTEQLSGYVTNVSYENETLNIDFGEHGSITIVGIEQSDISWNLVDVLS